MIAHALSEIMVAMSGLIVGFSLYLMVNGFRQFKGWVGVAWAIDRLGIAVRVALLGILIYGKPVPFSGLAMIYGVGLLFSLIGSVALAIYRKTP